MYLEASALHTPEPGHLALGKLVDGNLEALGHLVVGGHARPIIRLSTGGSSLSGVGFSRL